MKQELVQDYFSILPKPYIVYRLTHKKNRFYYTFNNDEPSFYISLTTLIRATVPKSEIIIKWIADMGYEKAMKYMEERADYGNYMHILFAYIMKNGKYDFGKTAETCQEYAKKEGWQFKEEWADDINDDVAGFMQFLIDYKVNPIALEMVLVSKQGFGTAIDLICKMTIEEKGFFGEVYKTGDRKGQPKESKSEREITALINYKSSRKGVYEESEIQLEFERRIFEENYPNIKIDKTYNYSPTEWRTEPGYKLTDQTDSVNKDKADHLLAIGQIELMKKLPVFKEISGEIKVGEMPTIKYVGAIDYVRDLHKQ